MGILDKFSLLPNFISPGVGSNIYRHIVEAAPNAIVLVDSHGKIVLINAQTEKLFGYTRKELVGKRIEVLVPERFRAAHPGYRDSFFSRPSVRSMGAGRDLFGLHSGVVGGESVPVQRPSRERSPWTLAPTARVAA